MKISYSKIILLTFSLVPLQTLYAVPESAKQLIAVHPITRAMENAYRTNPQLHQAIRSQFSLAERVPGALAGWRPNVGLNATGTGSRTITEGTQTASDVLGNTQKRGIDNKTKGTNISTGVTLSQNLYNGWQTTHGVSAAENEVLSGEATVLKTEQEILLSAAKAYLDLWQAKQTLEFRLASEKFAQRSYDELKAQAEVGEKTITAVAEAEANLANAIAQRIAAEASLEAARASYAQVIGEEAPEDLQTPYDVPELMPLPTDLKNFERESLDKNPTYLASFFKEKATEQAVYASEGTILPTVDLQVSGNRNFQKDGAAKNTSQTHSRANTGQVQLQVKVPLYQSGSEWSAIRKANQDRYAQRNDVRVQRRTVEQAVKSTWSQLQASRLNVKQFELAVKAGEVTLEGKRQEYLVGESTLTDMLKAQSDLVQAQTNLVNAMNNYYNSGYQVLSLYGNLLPETLELGVNRYDIKGYADQVRGQFIGTGDLRENFEGLKE